MPMVGSRQISNASIGIGVGLGIGIGMECDADQPYELLGSATTPSSAWGWWRGSVAESFVALAREHGLHRASCAVGGAWRQVFSLGALLEPGFPMGDTVGGK